MFGGSFVNQADNLPTMPAIEFDLVPASEIEVDLVPVRSFEPGWAQLPDLIVEKIFGYLNKQDRVSASKACSAWNNALHFPVNWRVMRVNLNRDFTQAPGQSQSSSVEPLIIFLVQKFGNYIRRLELTWSRPLIQDCGKLHQQLHICQARECTSFFIVLKRCKMRLRELVLTDWINRYKWNNRMRVMAKLISFLSSQKRIERLSLYNACLGMNEVLQLVAAVSRPRKGSNVKKIDLRRAFREWKVPHANSRFLDMFGRLKALTAIAIDYATLSNETIKALSQAATKSLTILRIEVRDTDNRSHSISNAVWKMLATSCPQLRVGINFVNIAHYEDIGYILLPSIPLFSIHLLCGKVWDQTRSRNFHSTLSLLLTNYTRTLEDIQLEMKNSREQLDNLLLELILKCRNLSNFEYDGIITNMDTLRAICEYQLHLKTNFEQMYFWPRMMTNANCSCVEDICSQFTHKLAEKRVDFKIDVAPCVYMYTSGKSQHNGTNKY